MCLVCLVPDLSSRWVSRRTPHSLLFPSAASRKGFPSTKRSNSQCKAALAATVFFFFFGLHVQLSLFHQSNLLVFPSLSHNHSFSRLHTFCSHHSNHSLLDFNTVRLHLSTTKHQTGSTHSRRSGLCKHWWSSQQPTTNIWAFHLTHLPFHPKLISCRYSRQYADRYDDSPLKSPGTYL